MKEDSEKISLFIGDYIFRRRYVRGDLATFTCTGCEKISRKTRGGNKGKKDASAVAQITDDGYVLHMWYRRRTIDDRAYALSMTGRYALSMTGRTHFPQRGVIV